MGLGGFSWKRALGVTKAKRKVSRKTGIPLTKSGRQRKIGKMVTGGKGCLIIIIPLMLLISVTTLSFINAFSASSDSQETKSSLSIKKRMNIFHVVYPQYLEAEDAADAKYPIDDPSMTLEEMKKQIDASREYSESLKAKIDVKIEREYGITEEQIDSILFEGLDKGWHRN